MIPEFSYHVTNHFKKDVHFEPEAALVYIIDGACDLVMDEQRWSFTVDELVFIPAFHRHEWICPGKVLAGVVTISEKASEQLESSDKYVLHCNSVSGDGKLYGKLKKLFRDIIYEYTIRGQTLNIRKKGLFYLLADELYLNFAQSLPVSSPESPNFREESMERVLTYIHRHFFEPLTLEETGKLLYMSPTVFSRYFKKTLGVTFAHYLFELRMCHACEQLSYTRRKITDIALDCGFSTASAFNRAFKKYCLLSPAEYRSLNSPSVEPEMFLAGSEASKEDEENTRVLRRFLEERTAVSTEGRILKQVSADVTVYQSVENGWNKALNVGTVAELSLGVYQQHVLRLKEYLGIRYIRITNIFAPPACFYSGDGGNRVCFNLLDQVLDFLVDHRLRVIMDIGVGNASALWNESSGHREMKPQPLFHRLAEACELAERLLDHLLWRYGEPVVSRWIFDISYDRRTWPDEMEMSFPEYSRTLTELIKSRIPGVLCAVFGAAPGLPEFEWVRQWKNWSVLPDFMSFALLPYWPKLTKGHKIEDRRSMDPYFLKNMVTGIRRELKEMGLESIKLFAARWHLNLSACNYVNDTQAFAAQMAAAMTNLLEDVNLAAFDLAGDFMNGCQENQRPFFGGKGLVSKDGLFKPSCYVLALFGRLGTELVKKGRGYVITRNIAGDYAIFCFNAKDFAPGYYSLKEDSVTEEVFSRIFEDSDSLELRFDLSGLRNGEYEEKNYILEQENSVLYQWERIGKKKVLHGEAQEYLTRAAAPGMTWSLCRVIHGQYTRTVLLKPHEVRLICLSFVESGQTV